jgi:hypothetical protein
MVGQPTFTEQGIRLPQQMGPEAASRSELGMSLQFQLLRKPEQEDLSLKLAWGNLTSLISKNKTKQTNQKPMGSKPLL